MRRGYRPLLKWNEVPASIPPLGLQRPLRRWEPAPRSGLGIVPLERLAGPQPERPHGQG